MMPMRTSATTIIAIVTGRRRAKRVGFTDLPPYRPHRSVKRADTVPSRTSPPGWRGRWTTPRARCSCVRSRAAAAPGRAGAGRGTRCSNAHGGSIIQIRLPRGHDGIANLDAAQDLGVLVVRDTDSDRLEMNRSVIDHEYDRLLPALNDRHVGNERRVGEGGDLEGKADEHAGTERGIRVDWFDQNVESMGFGIRRWEDADDAGRELFARKCLAAEIHLLSDGDIADP